jgi:hypothetical protein
MQRYANRRMSGFAFKREPQPTRNGTGGHVVRLIDAHHPAETELLEPVANPCGTCLGRVATTAVLLAEPPAHLDRWQDLREEGGYRETCPSRKLACAAHNDRRDGNARIGIPLHGPLEERLGLVLDQPRPNG